MIATLVGDVCKWAAGLPAYVQVPLGLAAAGAVLFVLLKLKKRL